MCRKNCHWERCTHTNTHNNILRTNPDKSGPVPCQHFCLSLLISTIVWHHITPDAWAPALFFFPIPAACVNLRPVLSFHFISCLVSCLCCRTPAGFVPWWLQVLRGALWGEQRQTPNVLDPHLHRRLQTVEPLHLSDHHWLLWWWKWCVWDVLVG